MNEYNQTPPPGQPSLFPTEPSSSLGLYNSKLTQTTPLPKTENLTPRSNLTRQEYAILTLYEELHEGCGTGVSFSIYPSNEFTAACVNYGPKLNPNLQKSTRKPYTLEQSPSNIKNMKRAVQNHPLPFTRLLTLTFNPSMSELDENGNICHQYAQDKKSTFLATLTKTYKRKSLKSGNRKHEISYISIAELQKNGNIHFHILLDKHVPVQYLTKLWKQSSNSVDIKPVTGMKALRYTLNYLKKSRQDKIYGKRYSMSENLYQTMKPLKIVIPGKHAKAIFLSYMDDNFRGLIAENGYKSDWGFNLPPPSRLTGKVNPYQQRQFITELAELLAEQGYTQLLDAITEETP